MQVLDYLFIHIGINYYNDREIKAKVYPNPATTNISIETDAPTIKIIDEHGNFIKDVPIALPNRISFANRGITINKVEVKKVDLNISDLKRGNYYVVFTDNSIQKSISRTLIVQ